MRFTEDERYRASSQYKLWSFTPEQLAAQRTETNKAAAARITAAFRRHREQGDPSVISSDSDRNGDGTAAAREEVDCLTVDEEKILVNQVCKSALALSAELNLPSEVTATGVQFLKRFYLYNSPMSYDLSPIIRTAVFLACKTENYHMTAEHFASMVKKATVETILAPEYLIIQALRFTFEVRHPFRGLKGGFMEMTVMGQGKAALLPSCTKTPSQLQADMLYLPDKPNTPPVRKTPDELKDRIFNAYKGAGQLLKTAVVLSDAYFLYTPSQIWLAAHLIADEVLTLFYISTKFPSTTPPDPQHTKLLTTIRACAAHIQAHPMATPYPSEQARQEAEQAHAARHAAVIKKWRLCRDPDKMDLVGLSRAQKRDAVEGGALEESKAKRRKVAREGFEKEADAFWGPDLKAKGEGGN